MKNTESILNLINNSFIDVQIQDFDCNLIFDAARERGLLLSLHSIYKKVALDGTKLKDYYHHKNLKSALTSECLADSPLSNDLCRKFINYRVNFGKKYVLVCRLSEKDLEMLSKLSEIKDFNKLLIDATNLLDDDSTDAYDIPLNIVAKTETTSGEISIMFSEAVTTFESVQPDEALLSDAGKQVRNYMRLQKKVVSYGFHKVIIGKKQGLLIALIDTNVLSTNETPSDKFQGIIEIIKRHFSIPEWLKKKRVIGFFSAIEKLYADKEAGFVTGGYFYSSTGARFINSAKGSRTDLREDPFQKGGEQAEVHDLSYIKLDLSWYELAGEPGVKLHGSSEMFDKPKESLPWFEAQFCTDEGTSANFLEKLLNYAEE